LSSPLKTVITFQEADKGDSVMMKTVTSFKIGDRLKDKSTGKIFVVRMMDKNEVLLEGENGLGRKLTGVDSLKQTCEKLEDKES
jgi:hypothetical protein